MTGDEQPFKKTTKSVVKSLIGTEPKKDIPLQTVVDELSNSYHPFFLIPDLGRRRAEKAWRSYMGDHVVVLEQPEDTCRAAAGLVALCEGLVNDVDDLAQRLLDQGSGQDQVGRLVRALTPFAATLEKDGSERLPLEVVAPW